MNNMAAVPLASCEIPTNEETRETVPVSGIRALMLAVLDDAMNSLSSSQSLVRAAAEHWIMSPERCYVFSFVVICETLALEPSAVRQSVMDLRLRRRTAGRLVRRSRPNVRHQGPLQLERGRRLQ